MRFISVLSIYITTIYCSSKLEKKEWSVQIANVFFHYDMEMKKKFTYILVDRKGCDYRTYGTVGEQNFSKENFTEKGLQDAKEKMLKQDGVHLKTYEGVSKFCTNKPTPNQKKKTIYSYDFEPFNFMGYDYAKNPTLECLVNIWPEKIGNETQCNDLAHVELTFVRETDTTVEWKVVRMTKNPNQDVSDKEFKNFKVMAFEKAVYNKAELKYKTSKWEFKAYGEEIEESKEIKNVQSIGYIGAYIITFKELKDKKVKYLDFTMSGFSNNDYLNVVDFMNEYKEKNK